MHYQQPLTSSFDMYPYFTYDSLSMLRCPFLFLFLHPATTGSPCSKLFLAVLLKGSAAVSHVPLAPCFPSYQLLHCGAGRPPPAAAAPLYSKNFIFYLVQIYGFTLRWLCQLDSIKYRSVFYSHSAPSASYFSWPPGLSIGPARNQRHAADIIYQFEMYMFTTLRWLRQLDSIKYLSALHVHMYASVSFHFIF